jgi:O-acetyl-ADP-ribose deacetylase (regulator of RNase III)
MTGVEFSRGDITLVEADAIVNAANSSLLGGGGVDGAIHRTGGPEILEACRAIGSCPTGSAVITTAGRLRARYVIHAVAPRYTGKPRDARLLRGAYKAALELAGQRHLASIAFPSLGTGAYRYPVADAAPLALDVVAEHLAGPTSLQRVLFVLFSDEDLAVYRSAAAAISVSRPAETCNRDVRS